MSDDDNEMDTRARLTALGYTVERGIGALYDEEGVDGWLWFDRNGDDAGAEIMWDRQVPDMPARIESIGMGSGTAGRNLWVNTRTGETLQVEARPNNGWAFGSFED